MFEILTDHKSLVEFYSANGLEVTPDPQTDGAFYSVAKFFREKPIAAATLSFRQGIFILDYIAVDPLFRGENLGAKAFSLIKQTAVEKGASELYITTKVPLFFEKLGFVLGEPESVDLNADCKECPQLGITCHPKTMKLILKENL